MTDAAWVLLGAAGVFAVGDWVAVARHCVPLEYVCKPATTLALAGAAVALDPAHGDTRTLFVVALVFSLAGDVFLVLPGDRFLPGLASFLVAQLTFAVGFDLHGGSAGEYVLGAAIVVLAAGVLGSRFVRALTRKGETALVPPVVAYMAAISAMVASAVASADAWGIAGAALFFASDALIAETRFVGERPWGPVAIMVTYHLALAGLVASLV